MHGKAKPAPRLHAFVREPMLVEAAEVELRRDLRAASIEVRETPEFKAVFTRGTTLFHCFRADALKGHGPDGLDFAVEATAILVASFTERATDQDRTT